MKIGADIFVIGSLLAVAAFATSTFLTRMLVDSEGFFYVADIPNERSLHARATPRSGGLAVGGGVSASLALLAVFGGAVVDAALTGIVGAVLLVALISWVDDWYSLPWSVRLGVHVFASVLVVTQIGGLRDVGLPGWAWEIPESLGYVAGVMFTVWMANLYNFMDGMDGFAGGMAVIGFAGLAVLGATAGADVFAMVALIVAASAAGFLLWNFPPARIFLGDVGSVPLGVMAAGMILWGTREEIFPFWIGVLVFSPFVVDATVTLIWRVVRRERVWQAHRRHFYQRLVMLGWGHRRTVLWEYAVMAVCALSAAASVRAVPWAQWMVIGGWVLIYAGLAVVVGRLEAAHDDPGAESVRGH